MSTAWHGAGLWMVANMALAMVFGWIVGYERYFSGRAAGSQVYCLVCTTSCAVTLLAGFPSLWYWGTVHVTEGDPTRVIGAILTGIGFLGAGLIVKSGLNVRGLTTAASIWGSSAIGILVGVGFYVPAAGLTALFVFCVSILPRFERLLPAHGALAGSLRFHEGYRPRADEIHQFLEARGLRIPADSLSIDFDGKRYELQCIIFANAVVQSGAMNTIVEELSTLTGLEAFTLSQSRRA
ncbi:MgtC/SapB family protein [Variovorax sp. dw_308]|uniref:MgtC/SapB family protein n=1 Tax=Variovorax sp. dw_308 TaxID=2721546 RepID=UPI001C47DC93|nr:MgtC/SapB family protein [Variovorax sp. dw_308]